MKKDKAQLFIIASLAGVSSGGLFAMGYHSLNIPAQSDFTAYAIFTVLGMFLEAAAVLIGRESCE